MRGFQVTQCIVRKGASVTQVQLNPGVLNFPYICLSHLWGGTVSIVYPEHTGHWHSPAFKSSVVLFYFAC